MEEINRFNIRVYGIWIYNDALLLLKENYAGQKLEKFPGGGLEFGEGLIEGLKREFQEELKLKIRTAEHFYTQDFFVSSIFNTSEQIQTMYYRVEIENPETIELQDDGIEKLVWLPREKWCNFQSQLPVDKIVMEKLCALRASK